MATVTETETTRRFMLYGVSWETYERLLSEQGNRRIRLTYNRGDLELMSPSSRHEWHKRLLGRLVEELTLELNIPIRSCGSTTFKREVLQKGLELDECYYIQNEIAVRGKDEIDIEIDPPPDLAIEVDVTSSSINRMEIYAALGVPELWRLEGENLTLYQLDDAGSYAVVERSLNLPFCPADELTAFLKRRTTTDESSLIRSFRAWIRDTLVSGKNEDSN